MLEYWAYRNQDAIWELPDAQLIKKAKQELRQTGLIGKANILDGQVYRIPRCYPVYQTGYQASLKPVEDYLRTVQNLQVIGRYGAFKYNNQDHSILMGILAAENVTSNAQHDLWAINTDYETYQEGSIITATGLEQVTLD